MSQEAFAAFMARAIVALPQDLKLLLDMADDEEFDESLRTLAAGAVVYAIAPGDALPDQMGVLGYVDDALMARLAMSEIARRDPERGAFYRSKHPEIFDSIEDDIQAARAFLTDAFRYFESKIETVKNDEFKGKRPLDCVRDAQMSSWLYDELLAKTVEMEFDDDEVERAVKKVATVLPRLKQKAQTVRRG